MPDPLERKDHDLGIVFVPPASPTDPRVPTAEELTLGQQITSSVISRSRIQQGWQQLPQLSFSQNRRLAIANGKALLPVYPGILLLNTTITVPVLSSSASTIKQSDWVYLAGFEAEVGAAQDPVLGEYAFQYRDRGTNQIATITKENTRRLRAFWAIVLSPNPLSTTDFLNLLTLEGDNRRLAIADTSDLGFNIGSARFYARDPNLTLNAGYTIFSNSINLVEVCQVRRLQNYTERGYIWGYGGEGALSAEYHLISTAPRIDNRDLENAIRQRCREIFAGNSGSGSGYALTVQNLIASSVGGNPGYPGESAGSPNGSVCLADDQRVSFTNQAIIQKYSCQVVTATNNGSGSPLVTVSLNTSSPTGKFFSGNRLDHRIYSANGVDQSERGAWSNLGGTGSLIWVGDANTTITPGSTVYVVPGMYYPAGSGFSIPFDAVLQVWRNATQISSANIRAADSADLDAYADPANNEDFFVVVGKERAALHYILKRVTITTDANGVTVIPATERGCFAFIQGVASRIDTPVKTGLAANTTYKALVYYPPRADETWQLLMAYAEYAGIGTLEPQFLSGATVVSKPLFFIHTQGGGSAVHQGESDTQLAPIAMHLPAIAAPAMPPYRFNAPVQILGEPYPGPITLREYPLLPAPGLALPAPGQTLSLEAATQVQSRSLRARIMVDGQLMGFRSPILASRAEFQAVLMFVVEKGGDRRLVMIARNTSGGENIPIDSDQQTAFDTFRL
ncbi:MULTISPECIES: hypothetical protein [Trichocoleus]|uniref:Uncharacterized protein n=1 Tax=Trichocoleus desertorum GB2-A4 TaxID=2933944 RepID=A0ABV0JCM3_9CYAN|nr:hypothetical protein [Trichocoleus sp. FACHB-46]MBD1864179.1 hypothetical protein [Trichocoleus sp. FACHB-46]